MRQAVFANMDFSESFGLNTFNMACHEMCAYGLYALYM
jgi:hypothetical protein